MPKNRTAYKNQYLSDHYERINLFVDKGTKDIIRPLAKAKNKSLNAYILDAIKDALLRDGIDLDILKDKDAQDADGAL